MISKLSTTRTQNRTGVFFFKSKTEPTLQDEVAEWTFSNWIILHGRNCTMESFNGPNVR